MHSLADLLSRVDTLLLLFHDLSNAPPFIPPPVGGNLPPTISLAVSTNAVQEPADVILTATALPVGTGVTLTNVKFYRGVTLLNTDSASPYTYTDTAVAAGTYVYTAVALDSNTLTTTSNSQTVIVSAGAPANVPPTCSLGVNANALVAPATVILTATAADADGTITNVKFYKDSGSGPVLINTDSSSPYTYSDSAVGVGTYRYTAVALDSGTATTTSNSQVVTVTASAVNQPPACALSAGDLSGQTTIRAPASVVLTATASDADGSITQVDFYRDAVLIRTLTSAPYTFTDTGSDPHLTGLPIGSYRYQAIATDNSSATTASSTHTVTVTDASTNVALSTNGGVATASSTYLPAYAPSSTINGDRKGVNLTSGGVWFNSNVNDFPQWLQIDFGVSQTINEIDVFSIQDNFTAPVEPTLTMTGVLYVLTDFNVQYWNGSAFTDVPSGHVVSNNLVWRRLQFSDISTSKIRVFVNAAGGGYARIIEVEAWTDGLPAHLSPLISLTSPINNAIFTSPATVTVSAQVSAFQTTITQVDFYRGTTLFATMVTPTSGGTGSGVYSTSDNALAQGTYVYTAKATDALGSITTSLARSVTVNAQVIIQPPVAGYITIPIRTAVAFLLPTKGFGNTSGKHTSFRHCPLDNKLHGIGGDFDAPGHGNSYNQFQFAVDILERVTSGLQNVGWYLDYPYDGYSNGGIGDSIQPKHTDYVGWDWNPDDLHYWMIPGTMVTDTAQGPFRAEICAPGETVGPVSDKNFILENIMRWQPGFLEPNVANQWKDTGFECRLNAGGATSTPAYWMTDGWRSFYDPTNKVFYQPTQGGRVTVIFPTNAPNFASGWYGPSDVFINADTFQSTTGSDPRAINPEWGKEQNSIDLEGRWLWLVDPGRGYFDDPNAQASGHIYRMHLDTGVFQDMGPSPNGAFHIGDPAGPNDPRPGVPKFGQNYGVIVWNTNSKVLELWDDDKKQTWVGTAHATLAQMTWERVFAGNFSSRIIVRDPVQNVTMVYGETDDNFYLYRHSEPAVVSWLAGKQIREWVQIPNSQLNIQDHSYLAGLGIDLSNGAFHYGPNKYGTDAGSSEGFSIGSPGGGTTYGSLAVDYANGTSYHGGGDTNRGDTAMHRFNFAQNSPAWTMNVVHSATKANLRNRPSHADVESRRFRHYGGTGERCGNHGYYAAQYVSARQWVTFFGQQNGWNDDLGTDPEVHVGYPATTHIWDAGNPIGDVPRWANDFNGWAGDNPVTGDRYQWTTDGVMCKWTQATNTWDPSWLVTGDAGHWLSGSIDWVSGYILMCGTNKSNNTRSVWMTSLTSPAKVPVTIIGDNGEFNPGRLGGMCFCPDLGKHIWYLDSSNVLTLTKTGAAEFTYSVLAMANTQASPPPAFGLRGDNGMLGNVRYISHPQCKGMLIRFYDHLPMYFFRTA